MIFVMAEDASTLSALVMHSFTHTISVGAADDEDDDGCVDDVTGRFIVNCCRGF